MNVVLGIIMGYIGAMVVYAATRHAVLSIILGTLLGAIAAYAMLALFYQ